MGKSVHHYDKEKELSDSAFSITGYHVWQWTTEENGTGIKYLAKEIVKNLTDVDGRIINLYASWKANTYTINYNSNGGSGTMTPTEQVYDQPLELRTNAFVRDGYVFKGWALKNNGPVLNFITEPGKPIIHNFVESGSVTLYAIWEEFEYYVTITSHYSGYQYPLFPVSEKTLKKGESISKTVDERISKPGESGMFQKVIIFSHWQISTSSGNSWTVSGATISGSNFTDVHKSRVTITAVYVDPPEDNCVAEGTMITLADGSQKAVEKLTGNELLLVWNLKTGKFDTAPILFIDSDARKEYEVINLYFSDGTTVKVIGEHAFWDVDLNQYVFLRNDAAKYIGHWFNKQTTDANGNMTWTNVQLSNVVVQQEYTTAWSPVTYGHLCYYVNGMLSMPGATEGLINIFDVDPNTMKIVETAYDRDIEKYGLFTYEEFIEIIEIPEEMFTAFNGQYLKVAIGKGLTTIDELIILINRYLEFM